MLGFLARSRSRLASSLVLVSLAAGCAADTVIDVSRYDRSCKVDTDCTGIFVGDVCGCGCSSAAIAKSALDQYSMDRSEASSACDTILTCAPCQDFEVACVSGQCAVKP